MLGNRGCFERWISNGKETKRYSFESSEGVEEIETSDPSPCKQSYLEIYGPVTLFSFSSRHNELNLRR